MVPATRSAAMRATNMKNAISKTQMLLALMVAVVLLLTVAAHAAAPGITGPTFNLTAQSAYLTQPDGQMIYSWGYGCVGTPSGFAPTLIGATCPAMQVPGPTLIVNEGQMVTINLTNGLPAAAGNTSILFPGLNVTSSCSAATPVGQQGLLTCEAAPGGTVTYTFTAGTPGTRAYYSGTQGDLQVEMGLYGAIIVLPTNIPAACTTGTGGFAGNNGLAEAHWGETDFRLAAAAYDHAATCYDREYLFQFSEMDPNIHRQALTQVMAISNCVNGAGLPVCPTTLNVPTEPYHPAYIRTSPTTAIHTCIQVSRYFCASSARAGGSIRSTSTATTYASWVATEI
jgi:FtsP/CotA-like multicopper oxidase with cupredoxin domain